MGGAEEGRGEGGKVKEAEPNLRVRQAFRMRTGTISHPHDPARWHGVLNTLYPSIEIIIITMLKEIIVKAAAVVVAIRRRRRRRRKERNK